MNSLKRDPKEGTPFTLNLLAEQILTDADPNHDGTITFDEFLTLMSNIEQKMQTNGGNGMLDPNLNIQADNKVLDFLR
jgi:hypothetical protein